MGRGLSNLQVYILRAAQAKNRLYSVEILAGFFGWRTESPLRWYQPGDTCGGLPLAAEQVGNLRNPNSQYFTLKELGEKKYRLVRSSLSRSIARLEARGLVTIIRGMYSPWAAAEITEAGRAITLPRETRGPVVYRSRRDPVST